MCYLYERLMHILKMDSNTVVCVALFMVKYWDFKLSHAIDYIFDTMNLVSISS